MNEYSQKEIDWLLNLHKDNCSITTPDTKSGWKQIIIRLLLAVAGLFGLIVFPFFLLIRLSIYLNLSLGLPAWPALMGGISATILLLLSYILILSYNVKNKKLLIKTGIAGISIMVLGYCLFALFYLSSVHAKSDEVRVLYRSMHPIMRVAVATVTLADNDLVITDIERFAEDYTRMGLPVNRRSLHYRQVGGYVHAVDIRTLDRGYLRNATLRGSLELMGFRTVRHVGTADHLHVELPAFQE